MVNNCSACTKTIRASVPSIKCSKCGSYYHQMCVNISDRKLSEDLKSVWSCPLCQSKEPRQDNSNTPVRAVAAVMTSDETANALLREGARKAPTLLCSPSVAVTTEANDLTALTTEIKLLRSDIGDIKTQMLALTEHIKQCFSRIDEHEKKLVDADSRIRLLEERESEIFMCRNKIADMRHELNTRAQACLKNEIEIAGINEFPDENPLHIVQVISQKIGAELDPNDLDYVTRVGPRNSRDSGGTGGSLERPADRHPRPLVVRFLRRHNREAFLRLGKSRRNLTCADVQVNGPSRTIYINERLTQENRQLFRAARLRAKSANHKFCWIKSGTIYVRKLEGNPAIAIRNMDELERILCLPTPSA